MSYTLNADLWLERSRLDGMLLAAISYGALALLTIQATFALTRKPRLAAQIDPFWRVLLGYIWITFVLATIGFAGNARYTEMIWIDNRDAPGGPPALILNEFKFRVNVVALTCYFIMEWFMQALLLHRCFALWGWKRLVVVPMSMIFTAMVVMSIIVLAESTGAIFYNISSQLAYLCLEVGLTVIYTLLVAGRLYLIRRQMQGTIGRGHIRLYETAAVMVVESAAPYSVLGIIFIISFATHSNVSNLVFMSISHVQGIVQLLIIIRVAKGRSEPFTSMTQPVERRSSIVFKNGQSSKETMNGLVVSDPMEHIGMAGMNHRV